MANFEFSEILTISESDYVREFAPVRTKRRAFRWALFTIIGIALLFSDYTIVLGALIIVFSVTGLAIPQILPRSASKAYQVLTYLHDPATFSVTDRDLSVESPKLSFRCDWSIVEGWRKREDLLQISPKVLPGLYFKISSLEEAGVYDQVIEMCQQHGRNFDRE